MPEWQGAGVGTKFLEWVAEFHKNGGGRLSKNLPTIFHTSHPQLVGYLKNSKKWVLKSQNLYGSDKKKVAQSLNRHIVKKGEIKSSGYGGHFRAVQGFKYIGTKEG